VKVAVTEIAAGSDPRRRACWHTRSDCVSVPKLALPIGYDLDAALEAFNGDPY
jgi:hypothetical protein